MIAPEDLAAALFGTVFRAPAPTLELRGNNLALQTMTDPEILLVGAAGTGKTLAILRKLHRESWTYPGLRTLIVRKVRADLAQSTLVTYERDVLGASNPICQGASREHRMSYKYPNGSEIVLAGMDRPGAVLSAEYDRIYVPEAVQMTQNDWEYLAMRLRATAAPNSQLLGDTNPAYPKHWLKVRCDAGLCKLLPTYHEDNPAYYSLADKKWTARGQAYIEGWLNKLTGVRYQRYRKGLWVAAEGAVYEWDDGKHLVDPFPIPDSWRKWRAIDFGYNNPFACLWLAQDPDDRIYVYRQIYMTGRIVQDHARDILRWSYGERYDFTVADHDAEDRATLERHGISTLAAKKDILPGIEAVQARLRVGGDGRPRLMVMRDGEIDGRRYGLMERDNNLSPVWEATGKPIRIEDEFAAYVWQPGTDGKPRKEQPVDDHNHALDAARYGVMAVDAVQSILIAGDA